MRGGGGCVGVCARAFIIVQFVSELKSIKFKTTHKECTIILILEAGKVQINHISFDHISEHIGEDFACERTEYHNTFS